MRKQVDPVREFVRNTMDIGADAERQRIRRAIAPALRELRRYVIREDARAAWATLPAKCPHGRRESCVKCWPRHGLWGAIKAIDAATRKPKRGTEGT